MAKERRAVVGWGFWCWVEIRELKIATRCHVMGDPGDGGGALLHRALVVVDQAWVATIWGHQ